MNAPALDDMLTREQAAEWLQVTERWLADDARLHQPSIPVFKPGRHTIRYHPRTIIAALAHKAGVPIHVITASYGIQAERIT